MSSNTVAPTPATAAPAENVPETVQPKRTLSQILADLKTFLDVGRALYLELKPFEKEYTKIHKKMEAEAAKKEKALQNKKQKAPVPDRLYHITPLMAEFMDVPADTTMARKQVMRAIYDYLKANNLQNPEKKVQYFLDDKLSKLFTGTVDEASGKSFILSKDIMVQYHKHILAQATAPSAPAVDSTPSAPATSVPEAPVVSEPEPEPEAPKPKPAAPKPAPAAAPKAPVVVKKVVAAGKK